MSVKENKVSKFVLRTSSGSQGVMSIGNRECPTSGIGGHALIDAPSPSMGQHDHPCIGDRICGGGVRQGEPAFADFVAINERARLMVGN